MPKWKTFFVWHISSFRASLYSLFSHVDSTKLFLDCHQPISNSCVGNISFQYKQARISEDWIEYFCNMELKICLNNFRTKFCLIFQQEILVSDSDMKSPPMLPALGNVAAVCSYLILCMLSPAPGFIRDVWVSAFRSFLDSPLQYFLAKRLRNAS